MDVSCTASQQLLRPPRSEQGPLRSGSEELHAVHLGASPPAGSVCKTDSRCVRRSEEVALALLILLSSAEKHYDKHVLPVATAQPPLVSQGLASLLATTAQQLAVQRQWEEEWQSKGLASGLSETEYKAMKSRRAMASVATWTHAARTGVRPLDTLEDIASAIHGRIHTRLTDNKGTRFTHAAKFEFTQEDEAAKAANVATTASDGPVLSREEELQRRRAEELEGLQVM